MGSQKVSMQASIWQMKHIMIATILELESAFGWREYKIILLTAISTRRRQDMVY